MAAKPPELAGDAGAPKKKKLLPIIIGVALVLAAAGGGGAYVMASKAAQAEAEASDTEEPMPKPKKAKKKKAAPEATEGIWTQYPTTANLALGSGVLQATVDVQITDEKVKERMEKAAPMVKAKILDTFASVTYEQIIDARVKASLAQQIQDDLNKLIGSEDPDNPDVRLVVFSAFITMPS